MNRLVIQNGHVFLDDKEIQCITAFELKSSTDGTAELSVKVIVDLVSMSINQHSGDNLSGNLGKNV